MVETHDAHNKAPLGWIYSFHLSNVKDRREFTPFFFLVFLFSFWQEVHIWAADFTYFSLTMANRIRMTQLNALKWNRLRLGLRLKRSKAEALGGFPVKKTFLLLWSSTPRCEKAANLRQVERTERRRGSAASPKCKRHISGWLFKLNESEQIWWNQERERERALLKSSPQNPDRSSRSSSSELHSKNSRWIPSRKRDLKTKRPERPRLEEPDLLLLRYCSFWPHAGQNPEWDWSKLLSWWSLKVLSPSHTLRRPRPLKTCRYNHLEKLSTHFPPVSVTVSLAAVGQRGGFRPVQTGSGADEVPPPIVGGGRLLHSELFLLVWHLNRFCTGFKNRWSNVTPPH